MVRDSEEFWKRLLVANLGGSSKIIRTRVSELKLAGIYGLNFLLFNGVRRTGSRCTNQNTLRNTLKGRAAKSIAYYRLLLDAPPKITSPLADLSPDSGSLRTQGIASHVTNKICAFFIGLPRTEVLRVLRLPPRHPGTSGATVVPAAVRTPVV